MEIVFVKDIDDTTKLVGISGCKDIPAVLITNNCYVHTLEGRKLSYEVGQKFIELVEHHAIIDKLSKF